MVEKQRCYVACGLTLVLMGFAAMVMASLIVNIVEDAIEAEVKKTLRIQPNFADWDGEQRNDFLNTNINFTYHMFNITNLLQVQGTPNIPPALDELSYEATEFDYRFNSEWSADGSQYSWNWWWQVLWDDPSEPAESDQITSLNPAYVGALGGLKNITGWKACAVASGAPFGTEWATCNATPAGFPSDVSCCQTERHILLATGPTTFSVLKDLFLDEQGDFLANTIANGIPVFWSTVNTTINNPAWLTFWTNLNTSQLTGAGIPTGWGLAWSGADVSSFSVSDTAALWDAASPISLLNPSGLLTWIAASDVRTLSASSVPTETQRSDSQNGLQGAMCGGPPCALYDATLAWLQQLRDSSTPSGAFYMGASVPQFNGACGSTLADWSDLGACQFARAVVTKQIGDETATPAAALASVRLAFPDFNGFELSAYKNTSAWTSHFTAELGKAFLNHWSVAANYNLIFPLINPPVCGATLDTEVSPVSKNCPVAYGGVNLLNAPDFDNSTGIRPYQWGANGFFDVTGNVALNQENSDLIDYLVFYAPYAAFVAEVLGANGGVFTSRSPAEVLFGYTRPNDIASSVRANQTGNDPLLAGAGFTYDGLVSNYTGEDDVLDRQNQRPYRLYTGVVDFNRVRTYGAWRGVNSFQSKADFDAPSTCFLDLPLGGSIDEDCNGSVYDNRVSLEGASTGGQFTPFQEDSDPTTRTLQVWVPEFRRVVKFVYKSSVVIKGITAHRYVPDEAATLNETSNPDNAQYHMDDPDGVVDMHTFNGDAPFVLSRPHFMNADPRLAQQFVGLSPDEDLHETFFDIEPLTGAAINAHKRLQTNVRLDVGRFNLPYMGFVMARAVQWSNTRHAIYWPMYWTDEAAIIEDDDAQDFSNGVYDNRELAEWAEVSGYMFGVVFVVIGALVLLYWLHPTLRYQARPKQLPIKSNSEVPLTPLAVQ